MGGHPDAPMAEGLCVEQRRGRRLHDLVLLGGFLFRLRHVLCDPGCARTVVRTGQGQPCSFAVRVCPGLRLGCAVGDLAQHKKVAIGDPSYTLQCMVSSNSAWFHRPPRQEEFGAYKVPTELDQVWRVTRLKAVGGLTAAMAVVARSRVPNKRCK